MTKRLNMISFRKWLEKHSPDDIVGDACDGTMCPIAQWLKDAWNAENVCVTYETVEANIPRQEHVFRASPTWVRQFLQDVDYEREMWDAITAGTALDAYEHMAIHFTSEE